MEGFIDGAAFSKSNNKIVTEQASKERAMIGEVAMELFGKREGLCVNAGLKQGNVGARGGGSGQEARGSHGFSRVNWPIGPVLMWAFVLWGFLPTVQALM